MPRWSRRNDEQREEACREQYNTDRETRWVGKQRVTGGYTDWEVDVNGGAAPTSRKKRDVREDPTW